ncbi:MAG: class I SAM-dependent methyltransferase [Rhodocyclales bacterium]|nr:class I SAM-dependent methyltransferase [Rhodocyclales bacterium]
MAPEQASYLDWIRYVELCSVRSLFPDNGSVLEIGGGNGYQAAVLKSWGLAVVSIDIDTQGAWTKRYFDVVGYDGKTIPIADGKVDVIFSSNVLEHIAEDALQALFTDMRRVLVPGGFAVHLVPTPVWRLWTIMAHYPWLILRVIRGTPRGGEWFSQAWLLLSSAVACWVYLSAHCGLRHTANIPAVLPSYLPFVSAHGASVLPLVALRCTSAIQQGFLYGIHAISQLADVMAALFVQTAGQRMQGLCGETHHTLWRQ